MSLTKLKNELSEIIHVNDVELFTIKVLEYIEICMREPKSINSHMFSIFRTPVLKNAIDANVDKFDTIEVRKFFAAYERSEEVLEIINTAAKIKSAPSLAQTVNEATMALSTMQAFTMQTKKDIAAMQVAAMSNMDAAKSNFNRELAEAKAALKAEFTADLVAAKAEFAKANAALKDELADAKAALKAELEVVRNYIVNDLTIVAQNGITEFNTNFTNSTKISMSEIDGAKEAALDVVDTAKAAHTVELSDTCARLVNDSQNEIKRAKDESLKFIDQYTKQYIGEIHEFLSNEKLNIYNTAHDGHKVFIHTINDTLRDAYGQLINLRDQILTPEPSSRSIPITSPVADPVADPVAADPVAADPVAADPAEAKQEEILAIADLADPVAADPADEIAAADNAAALAEAELEKILTTAAAAQDAAREARNKAQSLKAAHQSRREIAIEIKSQQLVDVKNNISQQLHQLTNVIDNLNV